MNDQEFAAFLKSRPLWRGFVNRELRGAPRDYRTLIQRWGPTRWIEAALNTNQQNIDQLENKLAQARSERASLLNAMEELDAG